MKLQGEEQVLGQALHDLIGRRIGRITAVTWAEDRWTAGWFTVRLPGVGRRARAVPAGRASCGGGGLAVPYSPLQVRRSPAIESPLPTATGLAREVARYYDLLVPAAEVPA